MNTNKIIAATFILASTFSVGAMAQEQCGLSNGVKATGEAIQIGSIVGKTGPEDFSSSARAANAYFSCVNANGGINGRPIAYTIQDDTWNPEVASQAASKLVKDVQVVGMVGSSSFVECGANAKLYEQEGVAVVAGTGVPRSCFYSKNYAPFNQGPRSSTVGATQYLVDTFAAKSVTCVAPGIPGFGDWVCGGVQDYGDANGINVNQVIFDPGQLDGNAIALQVMATSPDAVVLGMPRGMMLPILTAAEQLDLGSIMKWGAPTSAFHKDMPKAVGPYWQNNLYVHMELEALDKPAADTQNWRAVMAKYGQADDPIDSFSQAGYLAAKTATSAMLAIQGKVDRASVFAAFKGINNITTDMLCAPWYFGPGERHQANHMGRVTLMTETGFDIKTECFQTEDAELADILSLEAAGGLVN